MIIFVKVITFIKNNNYNFIQRNNQNNVREEIDGFFILNKILFPNVICRFRIGEPKTGRNNDRMSHKLSILIDRQRAIILDSKINNNLLLYYYYYYLSCFVVISKKLKKRR